MMAQSTQAPQGMTKLLVYPAVENARLERIRSAAGKSVQVVNAADHGHALAEAADADAVFGRLTPEMLTAAARLRWVQAATVSMEHYIFPELARHECVLTGMRGIFSDVIADHVMAMTLAFARNLHRYVRNQVVRRWQPVGAEPTFHHDFSVGGGVTTGVDRAHIHLPDATMGIIGLGGIGAETARRAMGFGMRVLAVDPRVTRPPQGVAAVWKPERLDELLIASDFVVIAAPHTPKTERLFRRKAFSRMKRTAFLINVGRGAIVDLDHLCDALETGQLAGAGLDVLQIEPLPPDHRLWRCENVILTPHVAGASPRIAERHLGVLLENLVRFQRGEPLVNVVDKGEWY